MRNRARSTVSCITLLALLVWIAPAPALALEGDARLEGLLLDASGKAAAGFRVHLIDGEGQALASAEASEDGIYSFSDLPAGEYSLGIENREGQYAPVAAPAVRLAESELARRDIKLLRADGETLNMAAEANYGLGMWWSGLSPAAKTWTFVAILVAGGITWAAFDEDDPSPTTSRE
jgi:hypothetical protein